MIPRRRQQAGLEPGRHAAPVDQADAILWTESLRLRALTLVAELDERNSMPMAEDHAIEYARFVMLWSDRALPLLREIARA